MIQAVRTRALARAFAWALLALAPAACYYGPYPYATTVPASLSCQPCLRASNPTQMKPSPTRIDER